MPENGAEAVPLSFWQALLEQATEPSTWTHKLLGAVVALLIAALFYLLVGIITRGLRPHLLQRLSRARGATESRGRGVATGVLLVGSVLRWFVVLMAALYVLASFGVNLWPLLTGVGFLGAAIAFGSQALVRDLVSGLFVLMEGQYAVGEYVMLNGVFGRVTEVGLRTTALETPDGKRQYFPNGTITNISVFPQPRVALELHVPLGSPEEAERLREPLAEVAAQVRVAFPERLLEVLPPEVYAAEAAPGLRQRLVLLPGQEWVVNEELLGRVRGLLAALEITPPGGLAPIARPAADLPAP